MKRSLMVFAPGCFALLLSGFVRAAEEDPYLAYVRNAPEFKPVKQDPNAWTARWDTWIYMPWRYKWAIGEGAEGGQFCKDYGFNGGFTDHADTRVLPWLEKWNLKFYCDHLCGKGSVKVRVKKSKFKEEMLDARAVRCGEDGPQPLNEAMEDRLKKMMDTRVAGLKNSPVRVAYALDDEISWGSYIKPIAWRVNEDDKAYETWLSVYYGGKPPAARYVTPEFTKAQLGNALKDIDLSPLLDRVTYNDGVWANFLGRLVEYANALDPQTPCGFVGSQSPNLWGGFDYAKLCKKNQFIEAYLGTAQSIIRSFNPLMPQVTTHFHQDKLGTANDIWQTWWCFAHGNRGMIGWVEGWFDDARKPLPWLEEYKATNKEVGGIQGPKLAGARWIHDGVAIYYSHPSIQVSWCLDMEAHGGTWRGRSGDDRLGTWHLTRKAWEKILADSGIQYGWVPYDEVIVNGVPKEFKVLILPANFALSDIEARRIREFCDGGGTVIADFACGIFDQHGKGRAKGALDDLFGVAHDGTEMKKDFFGGGNLWVETNQDAAWGYKKFSDLFKTINCRLEGGFAVAEQRLGVRNVKKAGKGTAVYLNLSPQRYHQYREEGVATDGHRKAFNEYILAAGVKPWVGVTSGGKRPPVIEATYFSKNGRTYVFVLQNVTVTSSELGDTKTSGLENGRISVEVAFPAAVKDVVDERTGKKLGDGAKFAFEFNAPEAVMLSFAGAPPGR
ncbi:MAG: beta-galactosidase trimerization domain-containing protein [Planctomycetota bacterium]